MNDASHIITLLALKIQIEESRKLVKSDKKTHEYYLVSRMAKEKLVNGYSHRKLPSYKENELPASSKVVNNSPVQEIDSVQLNKCM